MLDEISDAGWAAIGSVGGAAALALGNWIRHRHQFAAERAAARAKADESMAMAAAERERLKQDSMKDARQEALAEYKGLLDHARHEADRLHEQLGLCRDREAAARIQAERFLAEVEILRKVVRRWQAQAEAHGISPPPAPEEGGAT